MNSTINLNEEMAEKLMDVDDFPYNDITGTEEEAASNLETDDANMNIKIPVSNLYHELVQNLTNLNLPRNEWGVTHCQQSKLLVFPFLKVIPSTSTGRSIVPTFTKQVFRYPYDCKCKLFLIKSLFSLD